MPITLRLSFACLRIAAGGASVVIYAQFILGWDALAYFAWGLLIAGVGLVGALVLSVFTMISTTRWRRFALAEVGITLFLMACLAFLWAWA